MPTPTHFQQVSEFPSDALIADIPTVSLPKLAASNPQEESKLWSACREYGFFLLDLRDSGEAAILEDAATMYQLTKDTLNLERQVLDEYIAKPPVDNCGFKPTGTTKTDDGPDVTSTYTLEQDYVLGNRPPRKHPKPIEDRMRDCHRFIQRAYAIATIIFGVLDGQLGLPRGTLADRTSLAKESATSIRLIQTQPLASSAQKRVVIGSHTDVGLLTLLFNVVGGLQILPVNKENVDENWRYIRPQMGCALVNIGDTLVEWTGWLLRSSLHRVVTPPGAQQQTPRLSLAYLIRPARGQTMRRLRGSNIIPLPENEDTRTVEAWEAEMVDNANKGVLRPRTHGGVPVASH